MLHTFAVLFACSLAAVLGGYWIGRAAFVPPFRLAHLDRQLGRLSQQMEVVIMANEAFAPVLARIDTATNNIAEDIRRIKEEIGTGMTADEVAQVKSDLEARAATLEGIAASTEDPVPVEPPVEPPV